MTDRRHVGCTSQGVLHASVAAGSVQALLQLQESEEGDALALSSRVDVHEAAREQQCH